MLLSDLLKDIGDYSVDKLKQVEVLGITDDSRLVTPGSLFIARAGSVETGAKYIDDAIANGAIAVIADVVHESDLVITVKDIELALEVVVLKFYGNPAKNLSFIGVTGTNGKTTISYLINECIKSTGERTALSGTVQNEVAGVSTHSQLTTPGFIKLQQLCAEAVAKRCSTVIMEVSSHALHQNRVAGIVYDVAVFTNLTQDHLDYHITMEEYYDAKKKLFTDFLAHGGVAVINIDDEYGARLAKELSVPLITCSRKDENASLFMVSSCQRKEYKECTLRYRGRELTVCTGLFGEFNEENLLCAVGASLAYGVSEDVLVDALSDVSVPGRMELVYNEHNKKVFVDYAHTPDALERVLHNVKGVAERELFVVFGCGGDRDKGKRSLMGRVAQEQADRIYVTSDNPRTEDPEKIIEDIMSGISVKEKCVVEIDREKAIEKALTDMVSGDCLVVAGKGHEDYQIIGTVKTPFDDKKIVWKIVENESFGTENIRVG